MSEQEMIARIIEPFAGWERPEQSWMSGRRKDALDKAAAILTTLASRTPEGMVMVPREPTEAMIEAGGGAILQAAFDEVASYWQADICWAAMLAASPTPEGAA